jgi:hypothetical protein
MIPSVKNKIELIKNSTKKPIQNSKAIVRKYSLFVKTGRALMLFGFIYQTIALTIDFCQFETVIDVKIRYTEAEYPSVTFCIGSKTQFNKIQSEMTENITIGEFVRKSISCKLFNNESPEVGSEYEKGSTVVESITPYSRRCVTYLSGLLFKNQTFSTEAIMYLTVKNNLNLSVIIDNSQTPPHLLSNECKIKKLGLNLVYFTTIREILLPFPYRTNCLDYVKEYKKILILQNHKKIVLLKNFKRLKTKNVNVIRNGFISKSTIKATIFVTNFSNAK